MRARLQGSAPEGGRRGATPRTVGATAVVVFLLLAFTAGSRWQANPVDQEIAQGAHRLAIDQGWIASAARLATFLGSTTCLIVVVAGSWAALWIMRMRSAAAFVVLTSGASSLLVTVIKAISARPRPFFAAPLLHANGYAFPSGHATNSTVVYGTLMLLAASKMGSGSSRRWVVLLAVALVAGISTSRVLLGVHWASDVLAGIALGIAVLAAAWSFGQHRGSYGRQPARKSEL
jgi:membrane-associated phospholipid phosphatase